MKSILLLLSMALCIRLFAQGPQPEFTLSASQSCPYTDISITNTTTPGGQIIAWNWTFENGVPSSYSGQNPPLVQWEKEGEHWVTLEIIVGCEIGDPVDPFDRTAESFCPYTVSYQLPITIDARCCPNLPDYTQTMLNNGVAVTKVYQVKTDLIVNNGSSLEIDGGSLLMIGESIITPGTPGGTVVKTPYIYGRTGSSIIMNNGWIKGYCESMWPGIEFEQDAFIEFYDSHFEDAYFGIHLEQKIGGMGDFSYGFVFDNVTFRNNYKSVTISENFYSTTSYIRNCDFIGDSIEMRSPFNHDEPHNFGNFFKPYYGYGQNTLASISKENNKWNTYQNLIYGIRHTVSFNEGRLETSECEFVNNSIAAVYATGSEGLFFEGTKIAIPSEPFVGHQLLNEPFFNQKESVYGFYFDVISCAPSIIGGEIKTMAYNPDEQFQAELARKAIEAPRWEEFSLTVDLFEISNIHQAIECGLENTIVSNTIFDNCITGIYLDNNNEAANGHNLIATCNQFNQPIAHSFNRYGIYLKNGSQLNDVGGNGQGMPPGPMPNGNGFPVNPDPSVSEGWDPDPYQACFGTNCLGNVGEWEVPDDWYSIYDANAIDMGSNASFRYYRYANEFVGDVNNGGTLLGVYPSNVVLPTGLTANMYSTDTTQPAPTCPLALSIAFPTPPKVAYLKKPSNKSIEIYPNPMNSNGFHIDSEYQISEISILDINGKKVYTKKINSKKAKVSLNLRQHYLSGMYIAKINFEDGEIIYIKVIFNE